MLVVVGLTLVVQLVDQIVERFDLVQDVVVHNLIIIFIAISA